MFINVQEIEKLLAAGEGEVLAFDKDHAKLDVMVIPPAQNQNSRPKILVTGGAGYIGSVTSKNLLANGYDILILDNLSSGHREKAGDRLIEGDVGDERLLDEIFRSNNIQAVVHFAGFIRVDESVQLPDKYFQNNVINGVALLNCMLKHGVKKIVFSSSAAVYGNPEYTPINETHRMQPVNPYGETKLIFEKILQYYGRVHGMSSVCLRYFNASGASLDGALGENHRVETHLIPRILDVAAKKAEALKIFGFDYPTLDGTAVRDYVHIEDLAEAHRLGLKKLETDTGCFSYNVGTGRGYSVLQVVEAVVEATRKMVAVEKHPRREGDPPVLVADNRKIKEELGLQLKYSDLDTIIKTAWEWHKKII